jgi:dienelactone hydrolase
MPLTLRWRILLLVTALGVTACGSVAVEIRPSVTVEMVKAHLEVVTPEGNGPFPVVIYYQGTGGHNRRAYNWAQWFKSLGVASAIVDNARMRGRPENAGMYTEDAALAWEILVADPKIDPHRFALMGFSRGGQQALEAAPLFTAKRAAPDFVFALYPGGWGPGKCDSSHPKATAVHIFFGDRDDIERYEGYSTACRSLAWLARNVEFHELRGATHAYDDDYVFTFYCCRGRPVQVEPSPGAVEQTRAIIEKAIRARWITLP